MATKKGKTLKQLEDLAIEWQRSEKTRFECERYINCYEDTPEDRADLVRFTEAERKAWKNLTDAFSELLESNQNISQEGSQS